MNKFLTIIILILALGMAHAGQPLKAVMLEQPPAIDGDLSDACWECVTPVSDFYYLETGSRAAEKTFVRLAYDKKNVYVAFDCKDTQPQSIKAQQTKRGGGLWTDDHVTVYFDLFSEYVWNKVSYFEVSAAGTQSHQVHSSETANTEWAGDWEAAAKMNTDGYSVEMRIPFSILRYDFGNPRISLAFERKCPRLDQAWTAPDLGKNYDLVKSYLWEGVLPPSIKPRPITLLYSLLGTGSDDDPKRLGGDIKYSLTPSLTGLVTVNPDFRNVEQQVESVDFTYNEQVLPDGRPFFQEARQYFPGSPLYYTRKIREIDGGAKAVGMIGDYQVGFSNVRRFGRESFSVAELTRTFGANKNLSVWAGGVLSEVEGLENLAGFLTLDYKWRHAKDRTTEFHYTLMNTDDALGSGHGGLQRFTIDTRGVPRKLGVSVERQAVDHDFTPYLGAGRDKGIESWGTTMEVYDSPEKGPISYKQVRLWMQTADNKTGGRFSSTFEPSVWVNWRNGRYAGLSYRNYNRRPYHDVTWNMNLGWNNNDLYRGGGIYCSFGQRVGGDYAYVSLGQGFHLTDNLNVYLSSEYRKISDPSPQAGTLRQTIVSAAYDITPEKGIVGRLITRFGKSNVYFAYRQKVRVGLDAYLIYGDPNAEETRNSILLKLIHPI